MQPIDHDTSIASHRIDICEFAPSPRWYRKHVGMQEDCHQGLDKPIPLWKFHLCFHLYHKLQNNSKSGSSSFFRSSNVASTLNCLICLSIWWRIILLQAKKRYCLVEDMKTFWTSNSRRQLYSRIFVLPLFYYAIFIYRQLHRVVINKSMKSQSDRNISH